MPKISISETITPRNARTEISNNTVFVPGYAITGPVNTPIRCENLDDFKSVFGSTPYRFEKTQQITGSFKFGDYNDDITTFASKGSYEKSYIYASELLRNGLPIVYERVMVDKVIGNTTYETGIKNKISRWTAFHSFGSSTEITRQFAIENGHVTIDNITYYFNSSDNKLYKKLEDGVYSELVAFEYTVIGGSIRMNINQAVRELIIYAKFPGKYNQKVWVKLTASSLDSKEYNLIIKWQSNESEEIKYKISLDPLSSNYFVNFKSPYIKLSVGDSGIDQFNTSDEFIQLAFPTDENNGNEEEFSYEEMYIAMSSITDSLHEGSSQINCGESLFNKLNDKGEYDLGFISSGAYPTLEFNSNLITKRMLTVAAQRGNSVALIDYLNNDNRKLTGSTSIYDELQKILANKISVDVNLKEEDARNYGSMFSPYATYNISNLENEKLQIMPSSFGYLRSFAESIKTNANWYATAGVTRGLVPDLVQVSQNITGAIGDVFQQLSFIDNSDVKDAIAINPIVMIKPYGYCIWGNRTLAPSVKKELTAASFLNVRVLADDIKEVVYKVAKKLTFELNNDLLWLNFKSEIEPTLDKMKSGNGLLDYHLIRKQSNKKATVEAVIQLWVVEAVENWEINIELNDTTVLVQ